MEELKEKFIEIIIREGISRVVDAAVHFFREKFGRGRQATPQLLESSMSETDVAMQEKTRQVIRETIGEHVVSDMMEKDAPEKVKAAKDFAENLAKAYGLDIAVDFYGDERANCGYYDHETNTIYLNTADLLVPHDGDYASRMQEFFDTIIHELRHAVQYRAVREQGFWNVDNETRLKWADNFRNYIDIKADPRGYALQPVEMDARTFAAECLKGVF